MIAFLISLAVLIGGYFIYGLLVERIVGLDSRRPMPALTKRDGVDYMPLPAWKVFLIQFLNIAGLGPIFGAIMGVMFGPAAFLWIVFGTIFGGAVHDFMSGVISIRRGGASLPEIVGEQLGMSVKQVMRGFSLLLMILVGAVFVMTPASLIASLTPGWMDATFWIGLIFLYYMLATVLPIDKLIGNLYPLFGGALLFMAVGILYVLVFGGVEIPHEMSAGFFNRHPSGEDAPMFPMMFVSIACGAISGFHATQSPMMARCLTNERLARPIFYGAMVCEGIVALIWGAAAIAFTGGYGALADFMANPSNGGAGALVHSISVEWLGTVGGILAMFGVIAAPITSGDTALRSARLIAADFLHIDQSSFLETPCRVDPHFRRIVYDHDDRFQRIVALFRMVQPDAGRIHSVGCHRMAFARGQCSHIQYVRRMVAYTYSGIVHDGGMRHIYIFRSASGGPRPAI